MPSTKSIVILSPIGCQIEFFVIGMQRVFPELQVRHLTIDEWTNNIDHRSYITHLEYDPFLYQRIGDSILGVKNVDEIQIMHIGRKDSLTCLLNSIGNRVEHFTDEQWTSHLDGFNASLKAARSLALNFGGFDIHREQLIGTDGNISDLAIHQISRFLNTDMSADQWETSSTESIWDYADLRRKIRPALLRNGYEALFQMPRAA